MNFYKFLQVSTSFLLLFCIANIANAAILYLSPEIAQYYQGDVFFVEIRLDTQGETINAVEVNLSFDNDVLEFKDFSQGNSILTLWTEKPRVSDNIISFSGGVPGGYWGKDGLLGKLALQARGTTQIATPQPSDEGEGQAQNNAEIKFLEGSRVLLNDGLGTLAKLETRGVVFEILTGEGGRNLWQEEIDKDKILPEPFKIEISRDPEMFEGKYFIVFSTTDKQTGIDHYEVLEAEQRGWLRRLTQKKEEWMVGNSPYVLENQKLTSDIKVKAIDKAGNFWMDTLKAQNKPEKKWEIVFFGLVLILIIIILWITLKKLARYRSRNL